MMIKQIIKKPNSQTEFNSVLMNKINNSIEKIREKSFLFKHKTEIKEAVNSKFNKIVKLIIDKWQKLGQKSSDLDKAIDFVAKTETFDKKEMRKKILSGDITECVYEQLLNLTENTIISFHDGNVKVSKNDAYEVIVLMNSLNEITQERIKETLNRDAESFKKIINYAKK